MLDSSVELFVPIKSKNSQGQVISAWGYKYFGGGYWDDTLTWTDSLYWYDGPIETISADVQPKSLTEAQLKQWGYSILNADAQNMYYMGSSDYIEIGNRARVDSDIIYDIKAKNIWPSHVEAILVTVIGET